MPTLLTSLVNQLRRRMSRYSLFQVIAIFLEELFVGSGRPLPILKSIVEGTVVVFVVEVVGGSGHPFGVLEIYRCLGSLALAAISKIDTQVTVIPEVFAEWAVCILLA